jgi:hypothetical protein
MRRASSHFFLIKASVWCKLIAIQNPSYKEILECLLTLPSNKKEGKSLAHRAIPTGARWLKWIYEISIPPENLNSETCYTLGRAIMGDNHVFQFQHLIAELLASVLLSFDMWL